MGQSRVQQLGERITDSGFVRNVIGPKVLEPVTVWYQENLRDGAEGRADDADVEATPAPTTAGDGDVIDLTDDAPARLAATETAVAETAVAEAPRRPAALESARAAERFLEGDAQDPPVARIRPSMVADPVPSAAVVVAAPDPDPATELPEIADPDAAAAEPETRPAVGGWRGARDIAMRVKDRVKHHNLNVVAAGIAFWSLLAIPAVLTSIVSIYGLVASPDEVEDQINDLMSGVSEEARTVVSDQLKNITSGSSGGLATVAVLGIVLALWSASGAVAKLITTMNTIWEVREDRKFFALRGVAVALTFGAIVFFLSTVAALAIVPAILGETALGDVARWTVNLARFPALLVFMMVALTFLYWFGPNRHAKWRPLTWGAFIATVGWLVLSGLFSIYTANFAQYNETYAAMGSVVVLLLWMFITAFMVLVGAEIDAAREERDAELAAFDAAH